jgi:hypothetical protein
MSTLEGGPIRLLKTAFVVYYHEDLEKARAFFLGFGMKIVEERAAEEIFFKGYGTEPFVYVARKALSSSSSSFGGAAYVAQSREEL